MKEKILAAIKAKFPNAKLSAKRMDAIAASIEAKAGTDETLIEATLDALNELYPLTEIAKEDQIRSTLEGKLKATQVKKEEPATPAEPTEPVNNEETPAWAKALIEQNKTLSAGLAALQGEKAITNIKNKLTTEHLKDIPESYWGQWSIPEKEEDIEAFVEKVKTGFTTFTQDLTNKGFQGMPTPVGGSGGAGGKEKATKEEVSVVVDAIM